MWKKTTVYITFVKYDARTGDKEKDCVLSL
jgi:hypothetical protein